MDFKKKFDYNDINNFLPDNVTMARAEYFRNKFYGRMPDDVCESLEVLSREEYNASDVEKYIDNLIESKKAAYDKIMKEFEELEKQGDLCADNTTTDGES